MAKTFTFTLAQETIDEINVMAEREHVGTQDVLERLIKAGLVVDRLEQRSKVDPMAGTFIREHGDVPVERMRLWGRR